VTEFFVGIGAQKAGTTWLYDQLALHPQVALPDCKEVHFFDTVCPTRGGRSFGIRRVRNLRDALDRGYKVGADRILEMLEMSFGGPASYRAFLERGVTEDSLVAGEITPAYATLTDEGFTLMRETLQDPRIIFIMRDPLDRYWSAVRMAQSNPAFLDFSFHRAFKLGGHQARGDYAATIDALDRLFKPEDVLYLFYEDLISASTLRRVAHFLGVEPEWNWQLDKASRIGTPYPMPAPSPELNLTLQPTYDFVRERFGDAVPRAWRR
jgi:hypothetical protein